MDESTRLAALIKKQAGELGITFTGISRAGADDDAGNRLDEWLDRGYHASMEWMRKRAGERKNPALVLPSARSVISCALNYYTPHRHSGTPGKGKISRYAWGDDYHDVLGERMEKLAAYLKTQDPQSDNRWYVDTGPVMDKLWAVRGGIGWLGKHTNVITRTQGSWIFLGTILTSLDLTPDGPIPDFCGSCTRCSDACPTGAIVEPYVVDSARCLSYLTIEHRGAIDEKFHSSFEGWIFGCDICQDVCPWNTSFSTPTGEERFGPREDLAEPDLGEWSSMTPEEFEEKFRRSPVRRTKHAGLQRNIGIVRSRLP